jgi:hypothetical protein
MRHHRHRNLARIENGSPVPSCKQSILYCRKTLARSMPPMLHGPFRGQRGYRSTAVRPGLAIRRQAELNWAGMGEIRPRPWERTRGSGVSGCGSASETVRAPGACSASPGPEQEQGGWGRSRPIPRKSLTRRDKGNVPGKRLDPPCFPLSSSGQSLAPRRSSRMPGSVPSIRKPNVDPRHEVRAPTGSIRSGLPTADDPTQRAQDALQGLQPAIPEAAGLGEAGQGTPAPPWLRVSETRWLAPNPSAGSGSAWLAGLLQRRERRENARSPGKKPKENKEKRFVDLRLEPRARPAGSTRLCSLGGAVVFHLRGDQPEPVHLHRHHARTTWTLLIRHAPATPKLSAPTGVGNGLS